MLLQHALLPVLVSLGALRILHIGRSQSSSQVFTDVLLVRLRQPFLDEERGRTLTGLWEAGLQVSPDRPLGRHRRPLRHRRHRLGGRLSLLRHDDALCATRSGSTRQDKTRKQPTAQQRDQTYATVMDSISSALSSPYIVDTSNEARTYGLCASS
jgi:hypothetical protein